MNDMVRIFQSELAESLLFNTANLHIMRKKGSKIRQQPWMKPRLFYPVRMRMKKTSLRPPRSPPALSLNPNLVSLSITTSSMYRYYVS